MCNMVLENAEEVGGQVSRLHFSTSALGSCSTRPQQPQPCSHSGLAQTTVAKLHAGPDLAPAHCNPTPDCDLCKNKA
jgi:hypothetical protein